MDYFVGLDVSVKETSGRIRKLVVALTFRVNVDVPARFRNSKAAGAVFGLTPFKYQSGESDRTGGISGAETK